VHNKGLSDTEDILTLCVLVEFVKERTRDVFPTQIHHRATSSNNQKQIENLIGGQDFIRKLISPIVVV
jgi:hypothetical protein